MVGPDKFLSLSSGILRTVIGSEDKLNILELLPASVKWRYIPEASPWWGGFWERMVGSVKTAMRITLHQCHLAHDETVTLFTSSQCISI